MLTYQVNGLWVAAEALPMLFVVFQSFNILYGLVILGTNCIALGACPGLYMEEQRMGASSFCLMLIQFHLN